MTDDTPEYRKIEHNNTEKSPFWGKVRNGKPRKGESPSMI